MTAPDSRLVVTRDKDIVQVGFLDRNILEESSIARIGEEVVQLVDQTANPRILISFANVEHLSSAALGALIMINNRVRQKGGQLRLSNIDPQIYEVFVITKLNKLFQIHDNVEKAVQSFK